MWRVLLQDHLKPWRIHHWLSSKVPRDAAYAAATTAVSDLYTRTLPTYEVVICVDENTNIQPRPRTASTRPARPGRPVQLEAEYGRAGALNLLAALNTRTGKVIGYTSEHKRAEDFIRFLELLESAFEPEITIVHVVLDNLRVHKAKAVTAWLARHTRFIFHFPPVHCSWMNQVEQWFSILQRKALGACDFPDLAGLARHLEAFIEHWNTVAHPFNWTVDSFAKALAKCTLTPPAAHAA